MLADHKPRAIELFDDASVQDPYPLYARLRSSGSVHRVGDSSFFVVCGWDEVNEVVATPAVYSSNLTGTMTFSPRTGVETLELEGLGGASHVLATADDPTHAVHRKILVPQLAAKRIRLLQDFVSSTTDDLLDAGLAAGRIEWMAAIANRLPMMVVTRLIGLPEDDVDMLITAGYATTQILDGLVTPEQLDAAFTAAVGLSGYISEHFDRAAACPGDNLLGDLATLSRDGQIDSDVARVIMLTLFSAGGESTASLLGNAMWLLATRPELQRAVRDRPDLVGTFIEETLRFEPPFRGHYRHVLADATLGGVPLTAGDRLLLLWGAVNRDPGQFDQPDAFRLDRTKGRGHMTFGKGAHFCVGAALARLEAMTVVTKVLARTSWIAPAEVGRWLPSILVRRLDHLQLDLTP
ncbi:cytochrome P450 [Mycolicibacterium sp. 018/SC-01/001]|uniref:cytochrome P450 n=1 Tax=Mycolicibacterium sp. 018/SC-01/001 TaxID=2592069 RepID=UPI00117E4444|nr:cytochrome P450 [Mycolicibacterium sp. 018/SC-01/001]TRW79646.1 cytochrome P450 [Mycolicibacterium sp. 018/SC-01/001]